jgi:diguanylate cyclase (GGDEF)-like protein
VQDVKVLVADDDATSRLIAQAAVRALGHECDAVADGAEAWDAFRTGRPDVVISDWLMPGLAGLQLCRDIRAHDPGGYTYLIMVTGQSAPGQILEGMAAGVDDYLLKPLDPDVLQARLVAAGRVTALHAELATQRAALEEANLELEALTRRDPLTGLRNRRALQEDLEALDARAARYGHRCCMALLDVDFFKSYNDTYGHPAGDRVLETVSAQLHLEARGGDTVYRYGGEEFLCIFPEQSAASGAVAVERIRTSIERLAIPHSGTPGGRLTISAGVATLEPGQPRSVRDVLKEADVALYRAKRLGRNRVATASLQSA